MHKEIPSNLFLTIKHVALRLLDGKCYNVKVNYLSLLNLTILILDMLLYFRGTGASRRNYNKGKTAEHATKFLGFTY